MSTQSAVGRTAGRSTIPGVTTQQRRAAFGARVRQEREAKGWSQRDLAARLDVARTAPAGWEQGLSGAKEATVIRMEKLFGLQEGELGCLLGHTAPPTTTAPEISIQNDTRLSDRDKRALLAHLAALRQNPPQAEA